MNSKQKGKRGELELSHYLQSKGIKARRGQQFSGGTDSPDIIADLPYHIECKRTEKLQLDKAILQASQDAKTKPWVIFHRKNNGEWMVTLKADYWLDSTFGAEYGNTLLREMAST